MMQNLLQQQAILGKLSDKQLKEMVSTKDDITPDFLVMGEMERRAKMREELANDQLPEVGDTVREELLRGGIQQFADGGGVMGNYGLGSNVENPYSKFGKTGWERFKQGLWDLIPDNLGGYQWGADVRDWLTNPQYDPNLTTRKQMSDKLPVVTPTPTTAPTTTSAYDPYDVSGLKSRLGGIEKLMADARAAQSPDGGYGEYIAGLKGQQAVDRKRNDALAMAQMGFNIAGGTSPSALTNVAQGAEKGFGAYKEAAAADAATTQKIMEQGLLKEAAKKAYQEGRVQDAVKLFSTHTQLKQVEIQSAAAQARQALALLAAQNKLQGQDAKLLKTFVENADKIAALETVEEGRSKPFLDALQTILVKVMSGKTTFDLDEASSALDSLDDAE